VENLLLGVLGALAVALGFLWAVPVFGRFIEALAVPRLRDARRLPSWRNSIGAAASPRRRSGTPLAGARWPTSAGEAGRRR